MFFAKAPQSEFEKEEKLSRREARALARAEKKKRKKKSRASSLVVSGKEFNRWNRARKTGLSIEDLITESLYIETDVAIISEVNLSPENNHKNNLMSFLGRL